MGTIAERIIFLRAGTPRAVALTAGGCLLAAVLALWARNGASAASQLPLEYFLPTVFAALVAGRGWGIAVLAASVAGWLAFGLLSAGGGELALGAALYAGAGFAALTLTSAMREALDRERAERRLLAQLNQEKNQLLGIAAHDLRSPIAVIALYTQYLLEEERCDDPRPRRYLQIISRKSEFMLGLVSDVLDFSRIEAGHLELHREAADWAGFVQECVLLLGELGAHRGITVRVRTDEPLPAVSFDANRMEQVLSNLVANGLKFSPDGSLLEVTVAPATGGVVTRVSDRGPGIPEEERARLFEPFRIGRVQPAAQSGTGLGLAIVRRIVTAHGGAVGVESEVGAGSTFWFTLPAERPSAATRRAAPLPGATPAPAPVRGARFVLRGN